ncbi:hypothetical protein TcasGA2_TC005525 [Tribolium castaneum]|uniref:Uncharacterized protein n=1 Tax=Tribolium castaneum TaxID=7070 RepID=D6WXR8_TRICA|nr:PREDICTED: uncharacterized protein LOC662490 [Tribolium castaneum]EFA07944.1 hypothetical protein TcasGA2_TC005525 [Tribolium castaneum]|eukprot:XP_973675.1 PREDICTED: uncharacterized protein LOC662490 [Tribolium castaneum]
MVYFAAALTVLLALAHNGWALQCWSCSSDLDPSCMDHFNATRYSQFRNTYQQVNPNYQNQRNEMPVLRQCENNLGQIYNQKPMCVKRIINVPYGKKIITRECKSVSMNQAVGTCPEKNSNIEFCEYCDFDGCNHAAGLRGSLWVLLVPAVFYSLRR